VNYIGVAHLEIGGEGKRREWENGCEDPTRELSTSRCCGKSWVSVKKVAASIPKFFPGELITAVPEIPNLFLPAVVT